MGEYLYCVESDTSSKNSQLRTPVNRREGVNLFTWMPLFIFIEPKNMKQEYWILEYNSKKYVVPFFHFTIQNKIAKGKALASTACHLNLFFVKYSQLLRYYFACISPINAVKYYLIRIHSGNIMHPKSFIPSEYYPDYYWTFYTTDKEWICWHRVSD